MPLALMGCEAQVHEKTNKCGTWAYHSVDGWYLFTSPEHYCTHNCHIKHTKSKRLSDTIQFQHKHITNPTITYADKVMHALADCVKAVHGMMSSARNSQAAQDLQLILNATQAHVQARPDRFEDIATPSATPNNKFQGCRHPTCHKFRGCRRPRVCPQPTLMITKGSHAPCLCSHQFQGCSAT
jgi:hypothetical protein